MTQSQDTNLLVRMTAGTDPEERRQLWRDFHALTGEQKKKCIAELEAPRRKKRQKQKRESSRRWQKQNPLRLQMYRCRAKRAAVDAYGGPTCACCGLHDETMIFLCIDHIDNDGAEHRKQDSGAVQIYSWLRQHDYPEGFQVLCHNCNIAKAHVGICPHQLMQ